MGIKFTKMHGAGNDFVVIDNDEYPQAELSTDKIVKMCDRKRGIGADGFIVLENIENNPDYGVRMFFFNNDGMRESMCGNGLRCVALYAYRHFNLSSNIRILTDSGILKTKILTENRVIIEIPYMQEFRKVKVNSREVYFGSTGVPHAVIFVSDAEKIDLLQEGRFLRYHPLFQPEGTNVNFISTVGSSEYFIRTYERGVEDETSACGTGITAAGICAYLFGGSSRSITFLNRNRDKLNVDIPENLDSAEKVLLTGPAAEVFHGEFSTELIP